MVPTPFTFEQRSRRFHKHQLEKKSDRQKQVQARLLIHPLLIFPVRERVTFPPKCSWGSSFSLIGQSNSFISLPQVCSAPSLICSIELLNKVINFSVKPLTVSKKSLMGFDLSILAPNTHCLSRDIYMQVKLCLKITVTLIITLTQRQKYLHV